MNEIGAVEIQQAAFRSRTSGVVIATGCFHDITCLPGGLDADLDEWAAGFMDAGGRFLDRTEAAAVAGCEGRLEARAYFAGELEPTLEAGRSESCPARRQADASRGGSAEAARASAGALSPRAVSERSYPRRHCYSRPRPGDAMFICVNGHDE